jgi:cysteinyl-tRNA synthetase
MQKTILVEYVGPPRAVSPSLRTRVDTLLRERVLARSLGEYEWADQIRGQLDELGVIVMDRTQGRDGTTVGVEWSL